MQIQLNTFYPLNATLSTLDLNLVFVHDGLSRIVNINGSYPLERNYGDDTVPITGIYVEKLKDLLLIHLTEDDFKGLLVYNLELHAYDYYVSTADIRLEIRQDHIRVLYSDFGHERIDADKVWYVDEYV